MDIDLETLEEVLEELKARKRAQFVESSSDSERGGASPAPAPPQLSRETQLFLGTTSTGEEVDGALLAHQLAEAKQREEEERRQQNTVFITSLPLKATEEDIYTFLKEHKTGAVRDIRLIRDSAGGRSKGMAYVEFYSADSVQNALELKGKLMGHVLLITHPHGEGVRGQGAARPRAARPPSALEAPSRTLSKSVLVRNLVGKLAEMTERDIEKLFSPFGAIEHIELEYDAVARRNRGQAIVRFAQRQAAEVAIRKMNGFAVSGEPFIVTTLPAHLALSAFRSAAPVAQPSPESALAERLGRVAARARGIREYAAEPTRVLGLFNLFDEGGVSGSAARETSRDVERECRRFGKVVDVRVDRRRHSAVFVKFEERADCEKAFEAFNRKMFDERPIVCAYFHRAIMRN